MSKTQQHHAKEISDALERATYWSKALEATLDAVRVDVCLTDRHRRIVFMNRAAERLISRSNALRVRNNHLVPTDCTARRALAAAVDEAIDKHVINGLTIALPASDSAGLLATIFPLQFGETQSTRGDLEMTAIFVQEPIATSPSAGKAFAELYNLTPTELRVLLAITPGLSVKEAAEMLGICETTLKTHLQHIYYKTGTSKRTELLHLLINSVAPVMLA